MTLREKILKTFVVTIREINLHGGPEKFFAQYPVGGIYYGEQDVLEDETGKEIGTQYDVEKLEECKRYSKEKLLVCADECIVRGQKLHYWPQRSLGASQSEEDAYLYGKLVGMQMNDKGVDWVLGPSIDMCFDSLMYLMAISDDPEMIVKLYRQVIRGIQDQGVCATIKHFPGLGTYYVNMHMSPGSNILPYDEWEKTYGYTYRKLIQENVMSVMTTHVALKSYDAEGDNGYYPTATFSKKLTTELLKEKMDFSGAVVTDALIMGGMATGDLVAETVQAFRAGADLLLWPPVEAAEAIEKAITDGDIPMSRLDDALERIDRMNAFRSAALEKNAFDKPDAAFADRAVLELSKRGMCLLRNQIGLLPLKTETCKKVLIVDSTDDDTASSRLLQKELQKRGVLADVRRDIYDVPSQVCWQSDIDALEAPYDYVIFNLNANYVAQWSEPHMHIWASHMFDKRKKIIINYGSPYFASEYFPEDPTYIEANCPPTEETVKLLADGLFGEFEFTGKSLLTKRSDDAVTF